MSSLCACQAGPLGTRGLAGREPGPWGAYRGWGESKSHSSFTPFAKLGFCIQHHQNNIHRPPKKVGLKKRQG